MGKIALVTAGTSDLGRAIALELAGLVQGIAVHYQSKQSKAGAIVEELKARNIASIALAADLTQPGEGTRLVREVEQLLGQIDILINNFGPILVKPWIDCSPEEIERTWRANILSVWEIMQAVLPGMRQRKWGRVVNLGYSRVEELRAFPTITPYAIAKTGLLILTRTAALTEAPFGITVNMISPGLLEGGEMPREASVPAGRLGRPEEVAKAIRFIISEEADYITGINLIVAGGWKL